jgi:hypothetical protein
MNQCPAQVSAALGGISLPENVRPYFLRGTFEIADIAATVAGAAFAYLTIIFTSKLGGVP